MPAAVHTLGLEWHEVARRRGVWCDACSLPAVIEADLNLVVISTLHVVGRFTVRGCLDCGASSHEPRR
jgi:hypothetical protein